MGRKSNFLALALLVPAIWFLGTSYDEATTEAAMSALDTGDTAWMVVASAFVLLMTPGLAFFYGGMVDKRHIISTMLQSFVALGVISVLWVLVGFSLCFGDSLGGIVGDPRTFLAFRGVGLSPNADFRRHHSVFVVCFVSTQVCHHHTGLDHGEHGGPRALQGVHLVHGVVCPDCLSTAVPHDLAP